MPAIVVNITTPLLALMDVAITGHMGSPVYIAAIALGGSMFNMIYWLFGFLRMGSSGMTAQAYGSGDTNESAAVLYRSIAIALAAGLVIIILQYPISHGVLWFMDCDEATVAPALKYFNICVWGAPAVLCTYVATGWLLGMQNSRAGMWISLIINISNIIISLVLVYVLHLKIEGVATGTLTAQWAGVIVSLAIITRYHLPRQKLNVVFDGQALKRFFNVNIYIVLRTLCLIAVTMWFTRVGSKQGATMLAVNTLLMQLFILFSYLMDGFAFAAEALVGKYIGARDVASLRVTIKSLFQWGIGIAAAFCIIYFVAGESILSLLSNETSVTSVANDYLPWAITIPAVGFTAFIWDGVFIGATATRGMFMSMLLSTLTFFLLYFALFPVWGNHGLWLAFSAYLAMRGIVQSTLKKRYINILNQQ